MKKLQGNAKRLLIGITGGMGAGKSALATVYRELGYAVLSADEIAREIVAPGGAALLEIEKVFGARALRPDGSLDRGQLRTRIAADETLRRQLEGITHPRIQARSRELAEAAFEAGASLVFYEAPLLFEAGSDRKMDKVICVHAPDEVRLERVIQRDGGDRAQAEKLLRSQMPQAEKMRRSDYLLENKASLAALKKKAEAILAEILGDRGGI